MPSPIYVIRYDDTKFDPRLFDGTGAAFLPRPQELTPAALGAIVDGLEDPTPHARPLGLNHWRGLWRALLMESPNC